MDEYIDSFANLYIIRNTETSIDDPMFECRCSCGRIFYATSTELLLCSVELCGECFYEKYKHHVSNNDDPTFMWMWSEDV